MNVCITEIQAPPCHADVDTCIFVNHDEYLRVITWEPELGTTALTRRQPNELRGAFIERAAQMAGEDYPTCTVVLHGFEEWVTLERPTQSQVRE